ncbi:MAG: radical SAM protein [Candidatus Omnitrophica bacterium]|nr:radical SAM protein [Candidatus Omnitrophota bacterium]
MKIMLIYPLLSRRRAKVDENKQFWPPLGLAYIASVLERGGHEVEILDRDVILRKNNLDFEKGDAFILDRIRQFSPGILGISVTTPNMPDVAYLSNLIKSSFKKPMIVVGGPHVSGEPILTMKEAPSCDVAVRGEGEFTLLELADGKSLTDVSGISYRSASSAVSNIDRMPIADIDELPLPARHLLDMKLYTRPSRFTSRNLSLRTTSIFTARGCPYRCNFCAGPLVFSGKVRFHSPARVIKEIEELITKYDVEALYFAEDMFLSSKKRAEDILSLFIEKGINKKIKWIAQAKANIITKELLELMKESGCVGVEYGFESGSQRVLDLMNKKLSIEDSVKAAALTRRSHLRFQANIIVGYPGERIEDFRQTTSFIKKIRANMIGFNLFMPLPGTPSYEKLKTNGTPLPRWEDVGDQESPGTNYADMPEGVFEKMYYEARLKTILPINLWNFILDNAAHPLRLLKVGMTQFGGVLVKTLRSISKLNGINKKIRAGR